MALSILMKKSRQQFYREMTLLGDLARHLQVEMPDELDRVCQNVLLEVRQHAHIVCSEIEVKSLTQYHCEHVLDVEELCTEQ